MQPHYGAQPKVYHRKNFPRDDQHRTGRLHIIYGVLSVLLGVGCVVLKSGGGVFSILNIVCPGIWGGVLNILAGVVGIVSCINEGKLTIVVTAILSFLSLLGSTCFTVFSVLMCIVDRNMLKDDKFITGFLSKIAVMESDPDKDVVRGRLILDILAICVGICVMFIALFQFTISAFSLADSGKDDQRPIVFSELDGRNSAEVPESYPRQHVMEKRPLSITPHRL